MPPRTLTLKECAEELGVHYMTAYRYVRLGMLPAEKVGSEWRVHRSDLTAFRRSPDGSTVPRGKRRDAPWAERLKRRMIAGDERGSWQVVEAALASGLDPAGVYGSVITPAMRAIGDDWESGVSSIAEEHRASAIANRIIGRLSARFTHRGRSRGTIVIGTPEGEGHGLAVSMVGDLLRGAGFDVVDLGHDLPTGSFVEAVTNALPVTAVAVSISTSRSIPGAERLIAALRAADPDIPIVVGGGAVEDADRAAALGADGYAEDGTAAVRFALDLVGG